MYIIKLTVAYKIRSDICVGAILDEVIMSQ
jgi:hypothetical protein